MIILGLIGWAICAGGILASAIGLAQHIGQKRDETFRALAAASKPRPMSTALVVIPPVVPVTAETVTAGELL